MDRDKLTRLLKYVILMLFITFSALYFSEASGYFEYKNRKKTVMTNEQIKQFEKDVSEGKNVDLKDYLDINNRNYQNKISKTGLAISSSSEKVIQKIIEETFKVLSKFMGE